MMRIIDKMRHQTAVYWAYTGIDQFNKPIFAAALELTPANGTGVRWEDVTEVFINQKGQQQVSRAKVFTSVDIIPQSVLWLGTLASVPNKYLNNPLALPNSGQVDKFEKLPTLDGKQFLRTSFL